MIKMVEKKKSAAGETNPVKGFPLQICSNYPVKKGQNTGDQPSFLFSFLPWLPSSILSRTRSSLSNSPLLTNSEQKQNPNRVSIHRQMELISSALRQAFVPKQQYETLSEENRAWSRLKKPLVLSISLLLFLSILIPAVISLHIVFPSEPSKRPFCRARRRLEEALPVNSTGQPELYRSQGGTFYMTEEEAADFYWLAVFLPSAIVFFASVLYLVAGWWCFLSWD